MVNPRTATFAIQDLNGAQVMQGYQIDHGPEWHVAAPKWCGIMIASGPGDLAKLISAQVHTMTMWSFHSSYYIEGDSHHRRSIVYDCYPDEMGGVVIDGEYLGYAEWLRRAIPKTTALALDTEP
jgi:hypothetical protein